jgi:hypothetical protein
LPREVFLSHSSRDRRFARRLAETLRRHGVPVWFAETDIVGAKQWHDEIGKALARCDWFLLVLSPHSLKSTWVSRELLYALNDRRYDNHIVPLLYRPCNSAVLSWTLPNIQTVDFTVAEADGYASLLRVWGLAYQDV